MRFGRVNRDLVAFPSETPRARAVLEPFGEEGARRRRCGRRRRRRGSARRGSDDGNAVGARDDCAESEPAKDARHRGDASAERCLPPPRERVVGIPGRERPSTIVLPSASAAKAYETYRYAPAVRVGDTVYVSGIPASEGGTYEEKARGAFRSLAEVLAASGASLDDVVELTTFHTAAKDTETFNAEFARLVQVHAEFFQHGYPAWTAVGTTALLSGAPFELRAVAVIGSGARTRVVRP